jgi:hypothetical protein
VQTPRNIRERHAQRGGEILSHTPPRSEARPRSPRTPECLPPPPPPPSRTDWTRLVPPPVLTGHVSRPRSPRTPECLLVPLGSGVVRRGGGQGLRIKDQGSRIKDQRCVHLSRVLAGNPPSWRLLPSSWRPCEPPRPRGAGSPRVRCAPRARPRASGSRRAPPSTAEEQQRQRSESDRGQTTTTIRNNDQKPAQSETRAVQANRADEPPLPLPPVLTGHVSSLLPY